MLRKPGSPSMLGAPQLDLDCAKRQNRNLPLLQQQFSSPRPHNYHLRRLHCLLRRKPPRHQQTMTESPAAESAPAPTVTFKKRGARPKTNMRKREKPQSSSESSSEDDAPQSRRAKRRQQAPGGTEANKTDELFATVFEAERKVDLGATNDATRERSKIGPTQAATNVRMTTMIDYAPDVCKDVSRPPFDPKPVFSLLG